MACFVLFFIFINAFLIANAAKQNLYTFIPEYANVSFTNPEYVVVHDWSFKKFNKTTGAFSLDFTFKKDVDQTFSDHITGFQFKNNEFKKSGIDFEVKLCPLFEQSHNFDIDHQLQDSNMTLKCPIKKGAYYVHNIVPDASNFPPLVPTGRWMFRQEMKLKGVHITTLDLIWRVEYFNN